MTEGQPFPPYDAPGEDGLPLTNKHVPGIPVPDNARRLAKDVIKFAKMKAPNKMAKPRKPRFKSDIKYY